MLRQLHKTEEARKDGSHVIFLIQVYIHYTVASEMSLALVVSMGLRALPLHIPYRVTWFQIRVQKIELLCRLFTIAFVPVYIPAFQVHHYT